MNTSSAMDEIICGALRETGMDYFVRGCWRAVEASCFPAAEVREQLSYPVGVKGRVEKLHRIKCF